MKMFHSLALVTSLIGCQAQAQANPASGAENNQSVWELVWSDEFEGTKLDRTKWKPEKSCWGGGNNERQCYTGRPQNIRVANGLLHLIAREERFTGPDRPPEIAAMPNPKVTQPFTSGKIRTRGIASWR